MKTISDKSLVVKSNALVNAIYDLTVQEQRIVLLLIGMINPKEDKEFKLFKMTVEFFQKMAGIEGEGYYEKLQEVTERLLKRAFRIPQPNGNLLQIGWLASCEYKKNEGCIELEISEKLKPYLLDLKSHYTAYRLKNILPLRSSYSIRIYEMLKQFESIGERYIGIIELRLKLSIADNEYKLYGDFKRKVILQAQKELPLKTDISFTFKEKKGNRKKVEGILFLIKSNKPTQVIDMTVIDDHAISENEAISNVALYMRLQNFGFTASQSKVYMVKYDEPRLKANLDYAEYRIRKGNVEDIAAYTAKIIDEDARKQTSLFEKEKEEQLRKDQESQQKILHQEKIKMQKEQAEQAEHDESIRIRNAINELPENERLALHTKAIEALAAKGKNEKSLGFKTFVRFEEERLFKASIEKS